MLKRRRLFGAATLLPLSLALAAGVAGAQETNTLGPPQLRDYSLPGQRTTPPAQVQPATPTPTPAPPPRAAPPARTAPATTPPFARPAPARTNATPAPRPERARPTPAPARNVPAPETAATAPAPAQPAPQPVPAAPAPVSQTPAPAPAPTPVPQAAPAPAEPASGGVPWLWLLPALALAGAAGFFLLRRRRSVTEADERDRGALAGSLKAEWKPVETVAEPAPAVEPAAAVEPVSAAPAEAPRRALLEIEFRPERAAATDKEAVVHYELTMRNVGELPAGNIRIEEKMFNASANGEVTTYFQAPVHELSGSPHVWLQPGDELKLGGGMIAMKREELQAIELQGRVIFVPMVAINVAYDWDGGSGRTSRAWVVGREPSSPGGRMGAFRLDLGPRIYRQVDRREAEQLVV